MRTFWGFVIGMAGIYLKTEYGLEDGANGQIALYVFSELLIVTGGAMFFLKGRSGIGWGWGYSIMIGVVGAVNIFYALTDVPRVEWVVYSIYGFALLLIGWRQLSMEKEKESEAGVT
ncbi:hypothetical protein KQI65_10190 [bacterium]|nr:hypothetical protein [bacterium]